MSWQSHKHSNFAMAALVIRDMTSSQVPHPVVARFSRFLMLLTTYNQSPQRMSLIACSCRSSGGILHLEGGNSNSQAVLRLFNRVFIVAQEGGIIRIFSQNMSSERSAAPTSNWSHNPFCKTLRGQAEKKWGYRITMIYSTEDDERWWRMTTRLRYSTPWQKVP